MTHTKKQNSKRHGALVTIVTVVILFTSCCASVVAQTQFADSSSTARVVEAPAGWDSKSSTELPNWSEVDWDNWETLTSLLNNVREVSGIPALAAVIVKDGKIIESATVGIREFGTQRTVSANDRFHLGSVTKSMTATIIGKLVEMGKLSWNTTVQEALPDFQMNDVYKSVTIEQLLHHQGAIQTFSSAEYRELSRVNYQGTPTERRAAFLTGILKLEPAGIPGETTNYANAGYSLAGYIAERVSGKSWEHLITEHIFTPLQMNHSGFGHPGTAQLPNQPRGHAGGGTSFFPVSDSDHPPMDIIAPAGNVNSSIADLGKYAISHLSGLSGNDGHLRSEAIRRLHSLPANPSQMLQYASGWKIGVKRSGERVHSHGGTTGTFYAELKLFPDKNTGVAILMNVGQGHGELVANKVGRSLMTRYAPDKISLADNFQSKNGQFQFNSKKPIDGSEPKSGGAGLDGQWGSIKNDSMKIRIDETPSSAEADALAWSIVKGLAEAINDEDLNAFHSYFNKRTASNESMFDFMAKQVLPMRGGIHTFHDLKPGMIDTGSKIPMKMVIFHMENGSPGYFGLQLDEHGKIDQLSLFVKSDICSNGVDAQCDLNAKTLGKDL